MVVILKPYCLSHQKPKTSSRQQHEFAKREPQEPPYSTWAGEPGKISAPSSRRRVFSLDSPLYRTRLQRSGVPLPKLPRVPYLPGVSLLELPENRTSGPDSSPSRTDNFRLARHPALNNEAGRGVCCRNILDEGNYICAIVNMLEEAHVPT
jgi:hypothetical protein